MRTQETFQIKAAFTSEERFLQKLAIVAVAKP